MKQGNCKGFTLMEMVPSLGLSSVMMAASITTVSAVSSFEKNLKREVSQIQSASEISPRDFKEEDVLSVIESGQCDGREQPGHLIGQPEHSFTCAVHDSAQSGGDGTARALHVTLYPKGEPDQKVEKWLTVGSKAPSGELAPLTGGSPDDYYFFGEMADLGQSGMVKPSKDPEKKGDNFGGPKQTGTNFTLAEVKPPRFVKAEAWCRSNHDGKNGSGTVVVNYYLYGNSYDSKPDYTDTVCNVSGGQTWDVAVPFHLLKPIPSGVTRILCHAQASGAGIANCTGLKVIR